MSAPFRLDILLYVAHATPSNPKHTGGVLYRKGGSLKFARMLHQEPVALSYRARIASKAKLRGNHELSNAKQQQLSRSYGTHFSYSPPTLSSVGSTFTFKCASSGEARISLRLLQRARNNIYVPSEFCIRTKPCTRLSLVT